MRATIYKGANLSKSLNLLPHLLPEPPRFHLSLPINVISFSSGYVVSEKRGDGVF
jgi:hypothetical protein